MVCCSWHCVWRYLLYAWPKVVFFTWLIVVDDFWNNVNVVEHEAESNVDRSVVDDEPTETEPVIVDNTGFEGTTVLNI